MLRKRLNLAARDILTIPPESGQRLSKYAFDPGLTAKKRIPLDSFLNFKVMES